MFLLGINVSFSRGTRRLNDSAPGTRVMGLQALGFTDSQISTEKVIVSHIGKDATVLYEFKKPVDLMQDF